MNQYERAKALLEGGETRRYHTFVTKHIPQDVAQHSWNMAMLLFALHPGPIRAGLFWAVLHHDIPERWVADVPGPAKWWGDGALGNLLAAAETQVADRLGVMLEIDEEEEAWLRGLDRLEGMIHAEKECAMGNQYAGRIVENYRRVLKEDPTTPPQIQAAFAYGAWHIRTTDERGLL